MNMPETLELECLEDRMMLSTVQIFAAGATGQETLALRVDDQVVTEFTNVGGDASSRDFVQLEYQTAQTISGDQLRIDFTNDLFDASTGLDRNLFIDRIVVDGVTFQAEDPSVFHTGLWRNGGVTAPGFLESETLNINGSLIFADNDAPQDPTDGRQISFVARGTTGDELVSLSIDGVQVETFQLSQGNQEYQFNTSQNFTPDQVQFSFDNDLFDAETGTDRNAILEFLEIEDLATNETTRFTGESSSVFSTGTWRPEDGITDGFGRGNTLHSNGFFQFGSEPTSSAGSLIRFAAAGTTGEEIAQVIVNDEVVFETVLNGTFTQFGRVTRSEYQVVLDQNVDLTDIKIAFVNDGLSESGGDRDLLLDYVYVQDLETGEVQRTTAADDSTFSTGTFVDGSLESGFGRGIALNTNGYFEFANSSRIVVRASGTTGEERFQVLIKGEIVGEFRADESTEYEWSTARGYVVDLPEAVSIEDVRIQFINDGVDANGVDRNLSVSEVRLDGRAYDTDTAFSTGTYLESDGVVPGTGRGSILHTDGYFQFGVVSDAGRISLTSRDSPEVRVQWLADATTSTIIGARVVEESGDMILRLERKETSFGLGLDAGFVTYQVFPSSSGSLPSSVSQDPVTVVFEDGQLAANLVIPVADNNVADSGFFQIRLIDQSENISGAPGSIDVQLTDAD